MKIEYFIDSKETIEDNKVFVLIIYDIEDNKRRNALSKFLLGYGFRIQKSAFEAKISKNKYEKMLKKIPLFASENDSIRIYKIIGKGQVTCFGRKENYISEEVMIF